MKKKVRVLVIDDSALMRKLIPRILEQDDSIEVVGTALDGNFGLKKIKELAPHVVTLDLEMPGLNGIDTLKEIMRHWKLPVIVVSSHSKAGAAITLKALTLGAFDFVAKPEDVSARMPEIAVELIGKIRAAAQNGAAAPVFLPEEAPSELLRKQGPTAPTRVIAIGVSTGGPNALQYLFSNLPVEFNGTILVVQHMPDGFTELFAKRLDDTCPIRVKEAQSGDLLVAGRALICPGNRHMKVKRLPLGNVVVLNEDGPVNGHRPSADVLFRSVAHEFGSQAVAVLMTGMGEDGAAGMGEILAQGGLTIAQSRKTCVVFGMPKAAIERGFATRIVDLQDLPNVLQVQCSADRERVDDRDISKATRAGRS
ncbi:MAG: chemotaxis response regulator protein-glutamate methylesterase [Terriglobales bacterium]|jgi:two-component system, chemotaxis family, protein-glutamate methylesterase/glutaminase